MNRSMWMDVRVFVGRVPPINRENGWPGLSDTVNVQVLLARVEAALFQAGVRQRVCTAYAQSVFDEAYALRPVKPPPCESRSKRARADVDLLWKEYRAEDRDFCAAGGMYGKLVEILSRDITLVKEKADERD